MWNTSNGNNVGSGGGVNNFPVYINLSDVGASFWSGMRSDCGDIRVTAADASTELPREVVTCSFATKSGELWFKAPWLSSTTTTTFFLYAGSSTAADFATTTTYGAQNVWDSNYVLVWHLKDGATLSASDSTSNASNGVNTGATAGAGKMDGAANFDGATHYIATPSLTSLVNSTTTITVETWFNPNASGVIVDESGTAVPNNPTWHDSQLEDVSNTIYGRIWNLSAVNLGAMASGVEAQRPRQTTLLDSSITAIDVSFSDTSRPTY